MKRYNYHSRIPDDLAKELFKEHLFQIKTEYDCSRDKLTRASQRFTDEVFYMIDADVNDNDYNLLQELYYISNLYHNLGIRYFGLIDELKELNRYED